MEVFNEQLENHNTRLMIEPKQGNYVDSDAFVEYAAKVMKINLIAFPKIKHVYMFDQATTHTAAAISLCSLSKGYNTKPPKTTPKTVKWTTNDEISTFDLFDNNNTVFKGTEQIAVELGLLTEPQAKATKKADIAELLSNHPGFLQHSKLEAMAKSISPDITVLFIPKC